jgi:hypothetical protein
VAFFQIATLAYLVGGFYSALVFTLAWRKGGCALGRQWLELAIVAFVLWPLIWLEDSIQSIKNRERNRIAKARRGRE